eukprot:85028_1
MGWRPKAMRIVPRKPKIYYKVECDSLATPFQLHHRNVVLPTMFELFQYEKMAHVPRLKSLRVCVDCSPKSNVKTRNHLFSVMSALRIITGARPRWREEPMSVDTRSRPFPKLSSTYVVLSGDQMWRFLERTVHQIIPETGEFRGFEPVFKGNQKRSDQVCFNAKLGTFYGCDELEYDWEQLARIKDVTIEIQTSAKTEEEGSQLLRLHQIPVRRWKFPETLAAEEKAKNSSETAEK